MEKPQILYVIFVSGKNLRVLIGLLEENKVKFVILVACSQLKQLKKQPEK